MPLSGIRTLPTARSRSVLTMSRQRGRGGASWRAGRPRRHSRPGGSSGRFWNRHDRRRLLNTGYRAEGSDWGRPRPDKVKTGNRQAPTPSPTGCQCARTTGRSSSVIGRVRAERAKEWWRRLPGHLLRQMSKMHHPGSHRGENEDGAALNDLASIRTCPSPNCGARVAPALPRAGNRLALKVRWPRKAPENVRSEERHRDAPSGTRRRD